MGQSPDNVVGSRAGPVNDIAQAFRAEPLNPDPSSCMRFTAPEPRGWVPGVPPGAPDNDNDNVTATVLGAQLWDAFIAQLNREQPLFGGTEPHVNFLGSIEKHRGIFMRACAALPADVVGVEVPQDLLNLAVYGAHHDTCPTRKTALSIAEQDIDRWWLGYFQSAHDAVRRLASQAIHELRGGKS